MTKVALHLLIVEKIKTKWKIKTMPKNKKEREENSK